MSETITRKVVKLILELLEARSRSATRRVRDAIVKADSRLRAASTTNRIFSDTSSIEFKALLDSMGYIEIQELPAGKGDSSKFSTFVFKEKEDDKDPIRIVLATGVIAGDEGEKAQLAGIEGIIGGRMVKIIIGNDTYDVDGFRQIKGNKKADFAFTNGSTDVAFIQHKSPTHQQMSGIKKFMNEEGGSNYQDITDLITEVKADIAANGKLTRAISVPITNNELKMLAVYGTMTPSFSINAVQAYCIGALGLKEVSTDTYELTAPTLYTFPTVPAGADTPVLVATYRKGRTQAGIKDVRLGIYPESYVQRKSS